MAIARPLLLTQISGTLGPVEFAQHKSLVIIRNRKKPKTKITPALIEAQRLQARKITEWHRLQSTWPSEVTAWKTWAARHPYKNRLGQTRTLSAFQWFMKLYTPTRYDPNWTRQVPILFPNLQTPTDFWATISTLEGEPTLLVNSDFNLAYGDTIIKTFYYSDPIPPSGNTRRLRHHHLANIYCGSADTTPIDFTALCAQRNISFKMDDQIIITVVGIISRHPRSRPASITVTVDA